MPGGNACQWRHAATWAVPSRLPVFESLWGLSGTWLGWVGASALASSLVGSLFIGRPGAAPVGRPRPKRRRPRRRLGRNRLLRRTHWDEDPVGLGAARLGRLLWSSSAASPRLLSVSRRRERE